MLIDTHAHLYLPDFDEDREEILKAANEEGVERIFLPNIDRESISPMLDLVNRYPAQCFPMIGLHPTSVKADFMEALNNIRNWLDQEQFYGIGETGIDLYWDKQFLKQQQQSFAHQIELAIEHHLPIIIHCRESFDQIMEVIDRYNGHNLQGIFHCFTGNFEQAQQVISKGFKLGIGGVVTFKNSGLDRVIAKIDPKHIVLETDAPFLAPVPHRGKRNESAYLKLIAMKLAEIYNISYEELAGITAENALKIFKIG